MIRTNSILSTMAADAGVTKPIKTHLTTLAANGCWMLAVFLAATLSINAPTSTANAQAANAQAANPAAADFVSGLKLLPASAAGMVRVPDLPALCDAWAKTNLSALGDEPSLQPLLDSSFGPNGVVWKKIGERVGVRPKDLAAIASGELVAAWSSTPQNSRHPSALCLVADIRGNQAAASKLLDQVDADLKKQGATRTDVPHGGETLRVYRPKSKPGQLLIEQVVLVLTKDRIIAADLDTSAMEIIDAMAKGGRPDSLESIPTRRLVIDQSYQRLKDLPPNTEPVGSVIEWFILPLEFGRIIRDVAKVDRGSKVKIIDLLERQGFDALQAAGGVLVVGGEQFDLLHRGYVHAPKVAGQLERFRLAARMLDFPNSKLAPIPAWVPDNVASFTRMNWKLEEAFWASESLVNAALDSNVFRPSIDGIRDDEEGPQIDVETSVLPFLDDQLIILTDNTLPATVNSDRMLVAIRVSDAREIREAVRKAMEVEPDVFEVKTVPGVQIWKLQRGEGEEMDREFFDDLGFAEEDTEVAEPLLETWAIAMVPAGKNADSAHLVFASHVELLEDVARRMTGGDAAGLVKNAEAVKLLKTLEEVGADQVAIERLVRLRYSLCTKYELARKGELRDSDSIAATLIRRLFENQAGDKAIERPNQDKWPEFQTLEKYLGNAAAFMETTEEGWTLNAFLLRTSQ